MPEMDGTENRPGRVCAPPRFSRLWLNSLLMHNTPNSTVCWPLEYAIQCTTNAPCIRHYLLLRDYYSNTQRDKKRERERERCTCTRHKYDRRRHARDVQRLRKIKRSMCVCLCLCLCIEERVQRIWIPLPNAKRKFGMNWCQFTRRYNCHIVRYEMCKDSIVTR